MYYYARKDYSNKLSEILILCFDCAKKYGWRGQIGKIVYADNNGYLIRIASKEAHSLAKLTGNKIIPRCVFCGKDKSLSVC